MYRLAYDSLLDRVGTSNSPTFHSLAHSDFPQINFWTRKGWLEYVAAKEDVTTLKENTRGKVRASQGINVAMGYVEKEDGEAVDGHVASDMRKCARSIWVHIATVSETGPPAKWGEAGIKFNEMYRKQMYERFPMLRLCESDWKVDQIATDNYPSWYSVWRKKNTTPPQSKRSRIRCHRIQTCSSVPMTQRCHLRQIQKGGRSRMQRKTPRSSSRRQTQTRYPTVLLPASTHVWAQTFRYGTLTIITTVLIS